MPLLRETDLYQPVKEFLESQGYSVKSEVSNCDVVAIRGDEEPLVVELKTSFTLPLVFQGLRRQAMADLVYLAVAQPKKASRASVWGRHYRDLIKLCRMLGLGLITVNLDRRRAPGIEVHLDPAPYKPRRNKRRRDLMLREFQRRVGDPNQGGISRRPIVTAYRQDALACAWVLQRNGPTKAADMRSQTGILRAPRILQRDVYGWFHRIERGVYNLTPVGESALAVYSDVIETLVLSRPRHARAGGKASDRGQLAVPRAGQGA
jgi:hypothetical protein